MLKMKSPLNFIQNGNTTIYAGSALSWKLCRDRVWLYLYGQAIKQLDLHNEGQMNVNVGGDGPSNCELPAVLGWGWRLLIENKTKT